MDEPRRERELLTLVEALLNAQERRVEVLDAVDASEDRAEASRRIAALLGLADPQLADAVLEMQVGRWTRSERERLVSERDQLRAAVGFV